MLKTATLTAAALLAATAASAGTYKVKVTNQMEDELLAPILVTSALHDGDIFAAGYVTPEAEAQILTGDPGKLAMRIGDGVTVAHGMDGDNGVLLAPGKTVEFTVETEATALRILAMVAPTMKPDQYVSAVVDLSAATMAGARLDRYDIGHDEGTMMTMPVAEGAALV